MHYLIPISLVLEIVLKSLPLFFRSLGVELAGLFVVPVALLQCSKESEHLPAWAWRWNEPVYGINGDRYWRGPEHANGKERSFWWRYKWLAIRNRAVAYSCSIGYKLDLYHYHGDYLNTYILPKDEYVGARGQYPFPSDQPKGREGAAILRVMRAPYDDSKDILHTILYVKRWPGTNRCLRVQIGWKLQELFEQRLTLYPAIRPVFYINPLKGYRL